MKKQVLILGGTQFIGRRIVERLSERPDMQLTLFNRQRTGAGLFPEIKKIKGDRLTNDVEQIANQEWDLVIDISCYFPEALERVMNALSKPPQHYVFVSTCSVYNNAVDQSVTRNEDAAILSCSEEQRTDQSANSYGNRKAECERILTGSGLRNTILRPALVFGPYDHTDRLYYWLYQVYAKETLLLPEGGQRLLSLTYVNDLVNAVECCIDESKTGVYNAITIPKASIKQIVEYAKSILQKKPEFKDAPAEFLRFKNVTQWVDIPLWLNCDYYTYNQSKMVEELNIKPTSFREAIEKTIHHFAKMNWPEPQFGMDEESRLQLLQSLESKYHK